VQENLLWLPEGRSLTAKEKPIKNMLFWLGNFKYKSVIARKPIIPEVSTEDDDESPSSMRDERSP